MSGDDTESLDTSSAISRSRIPPFFTRSHHWSFSTFSTETATDFPVSTPSFSTSFDVSSLPTPTQTDDPTDTDVFLSSTGTLDTSTPTSGDFDPSSLTSTDVSSPEAWPTDLTSSSGLPPFDSSITIDPSTVLPDSSTPTIVPDSSTFSLTSSDDPFPSFSSTSSDSFLSTDSFSTFDSTFTTSDLPLTTPSTSVPISTSPPIQNLPTSSPTTPPQLSSSRSSSPSPVVTTSFPSFSASPQSRSTNTGTVVAATTGAIALAIVLALLAIFCRMRHTKRVRQRAGQDPFVDLDLDGEMIGANQPLIIGDNPGPAGAGYSDPYTDDSQTRARSLSVTTGPGTSLARSNNSLQAVVGSTPTPDLGGGAAAVYYNQFQSTDRRSPPPKLPSSGIAQYRSHQALPQVQTQHTSEPSIFQQSSPSFDAGAIAYIRHNDQTTGPGPTSPEHPSPETADGHRLISAFSAGSGLSPQFSPPVPPPSIDEMWRSSPDPIRASSSYRPSVDRRRSFTLSVGGHVHDPGDTVVIAPVDVLTQSPTPSATIPGSGVSDPHTSHGRNFGSRPSPITEVTEMPSHSQEGSNNSGGTWSSVRSVDSSVYSPVVMKAQRVHLTPTALSIVSPTPSSGSNYGESLPSLGSTSQFPQPPPLPMLPPPQVQPLSLGKKRSAQATA